jgi:predicted nucleic acid-binding protein
MLTVDANVWIAAYDPADAHHEASVAFLAAVTARRLALHGPAFLIVEVVCALARRSRSAAAGSLAGERLRGHPLLVLQPLNEALLARATALGAEHLLRGADALYAATSALTGSPLVSWDEELVLRAGARTPAAWLAANP